MVSQGCPGPGRALWPCLPRHCISHLPLLRGRRRVLWGPAELEVGTWGWCWVASATSLFSQRARGSGTLAEETLQVSSPFAEGSSAPHRGKKPFPLISQAVSTMSVFAAAGG